MSEPDCEGRRILEEVFDGDLDAYADASAGPKPEGVEKDPNHPWHQRRRFAILTIDQPDDAVLPNGLDALYTRAEICELMNISDSGFGKHKIPPRCKSGNYSCYALADAFAYAAARAWRQSFEKSGGRRPSESIHQTAARLRAEQQNEDGPARVWYPPGDLSKLQDGPFA